MTKLPFMPLYLDAFGSAVAHLSLEEEGAYFRLLRLCWETPGCTIPADDEWIRKRLRVPDQESYQRVVVPILREFFSSRRGRYYQKRLLQEWVKSNDKIRARSEAGKKGAAAKHQKRNKKPPDKRKANAKQTHGKPEPEGSGEPLQGSASNLPPEALGVLDAASALGGVWRQTINRHRSGIIAANAADGWLTLTVSDWAKRDFSDLDCRKWLKVAKDNGFENVRFITEREAA